MMLARRSTRRRASTGPEWRPTSSSQWQRSRAQRSRSPGSTSGARWRRRAPHGPRARGARVASYGQVFPGMHIGFCTRERDNVVLIEPQSAEAGDELRDDERRLGDGVRGCVLARCECVASPQFHVPERASTLSGTTISVHKVCGMLWLCLW